MSAARRVLRRASRQHRLDERIVRAELFERLLQRVGEQRLLERRIDRRGREQRNCSDGSCASWIAVEPLGVGLLAFVDVPDDRQAEPAQATIRGAGRNAAVLYSRRFAFSARGDVVPGAAVRRLPLADCLATASRSARSSAVFLSMTFGSSRPVVFAACTPSARSRGRRSVPAAWRACSAPWSPYWRSDVDPAFHDLEARGIDDVALGFELGDRVVAIGRAGCPVTNTRSLSAAPFAFHFRYCVGLRSAAPFS